ncbi:Cyclin-A3-2 [Cardamine amara subsp. amara]|uniref:Cyclin-A3-2 n=1 Tax=Cardamine amara subsp. amara TaxID=228776 RepID=A0ABD1BYY7_CARAN
MSHKQINAQGQRQDAHTAELMEIQHTLLVMQDNIKSTKMVVHQLSDLFLANIFNQKRETHKPKKSLTAPVTPTLESSSDIDARSDDPQMCGAYVSDIYEYLREIEVNPKQRPLHDYIEKVQKDVTASMRGVLVDWLVEIAEEYKLGSETLYLTVSYVDRFLSLKTVTMETLQLVGLSAMVIGSKYERYTRPPRVEEFGYTKQEVMEMEADILLALRFELGRPTINTFLRRFTRVAQEDFNVPHLELEPLCCYLSELSILDYENVKFLPSLVAASAVFLARFIVRPKQDPWNKMLEEYTKYKAADLQECVGIILDLYLSRRGRGLEAVRNKYKQHKFQCVATMHVSPELPVTF